MNSKARFFLISVAVVALLLLGAGWYFSSLVLYPGVHCRKDHHVYCGTPEELGLKFEDVVIPTADGLPMKSWYVPAQGSQKAIVMVHGHGGMKNEGLRYAKALHAAGYNLLLLDLRRNDGASATMGYLESRDVLNAVGFLEKDRGQKKIGVFGFSMGAATSILSMANDSRIQAGIFSSGYASAVDELTEAAARDYHLPYYPLFPIVLFIIDHRAGIVLEDVRPEAVIGSISPRPVAIFHCDRDDYVEPSHAKRLMAAAHDPKSLWLAPCANHEHIWNDNSAEAEKRAVEFFRANL